MDWLWNNSEKIGDLGSGLTVLVAIVALGFAWQELRSNSKVAREMLAEETYWQYLKMAFDYPEYSSDVLAAKTIKLVGDDFDWEKSSAGQISTRWNGLETTLTVESEKYIWFLSILLSSSEKILDHVSDVDAWKDTVCSQLRYHRQSLRVIWPVLEKHYGAQSRLAKIVKSLIEVID